MKKKLFILFSCLSICLWVKAQSAELSHISVLGAESTGTSMTLQWTLGELAATTQFSEEIMLTEGFLQPQIRIVEVPIDPVDIESTIRSQPWDINIWPSPVTNNLNIKLEGEMLNGVALDMFDLSGRRIMTTDLDSELKINVLDLTATTPGEYVLKFSTKDGSHLQSFIIIKI